MQDPSSTRQITHNGEQSDTADDFYQQVTNLTETIGNLVFLACEEADDPLLIRTYAKQAEECLKMLGSLLLAGQRANLTTMSPKQQN